MSTSSISRLVNSNLLSGLIYSTYKEATFVCPSFYLLILSSFQGCLKVLVSHQPALLHLGPKGRGLFLRFLSIPSGFQLLKAMNFIAPELENWYYVSGTGESSLFKLLCCRKNGTVLLQYMFTFVHHATLHQNSQLKQLEKIHLYACIYPATGTSHLRGTLQTVYSCLLAGVSILKGYFHQLSVAQHTCGVER